MKGDSAKYETVSQIMITRGMLPRSPGIIHWSIGPLVRDTSLADALLEGPYARQALIPNSPWLNSKLPKVVKLQYLPSGLSAQADCEGASSQTFLAANHIRTLIDPSGSIFWDGENAQFLVNGSNDTLPTQGTIFAQGLWLSGISPTGELQTAIAAYGKASGEYDYFPGPLNSGDPNYPGGALNDPERGTTDTQSCNDWDQVWTAYRYEIEAHLADWADNQSIDQPIPNIMAWPGAGNPHSAVYNGFELPPVDQHGLAPFFDQNADGIYDPLDGDYPDLSFARFPDQITWCVFNDAGNIHTESNTVTPLKMEIQLTSWAFFCTDNPVLNNTIFNSYRLINKGVEKIDSLFLGLFTDFDLGCYTDDYLGCRPDQNSFFAYNADNLDESFCAGSFNINYGENPPAQAITMLNQSLDHFIYTNNAGVGTSPPGTSDPASAIEFRNFLSGKFRDGTPITEGGTGYMSSNTVVAHAFPRNPNYLSDWSMLSEGLNAADRRGIGSTFLDSMQPDDTRVVDLAYSFHREEGLNFVENVDLLYGEIDQIQTQYNTQFSQFCTQLVTCEDDCVWPGDLNADGIANHWDLLPLGFALEEEGSNRSGPYNWAPYDGIPWSNTQLNGENAKHLDSNGDGETDGVDFEITLQHFQFTRPDYQAQDSYDEGDELQLMPLTRPDWEGIEAGESIFLRVNLTEEISDLKGLAFSIEYDPAYIQSLNFLAGSVYDSSDLEFNWNEEDDHYHFAKVLLEEDDSFFPLVTPLMRLITNQTLPNPTVLDTSCLRFKNIKAYLADGSFIQLGGQTIKATFGEVPVNTISIEKDTQITVYPNPAKQELFVNSSSVSLEDVKILDLKGRLIKTIQLDAANMQRIDISDLAQGIYILQMQSANQTFNKKIIKQ